MIIRHLGNRRWLSYNIVMLIHGSKLIGCPVLSLHVGGRIAEVSELIIDPNELKIIACKVTGPMIGHDVGEILLMNSIREFSRMGMIVDSSDELIDGEEVIRVRDVMKLNFTLTGLKVETKKGNKLGKVSDFTVESSTWQVQQLIVQRPFFKAIIDPELTISRQQILEVDDYKIIIKDEEEKVKSKSNADFVPSFVNPFREPDFASDVQSRKEEK